MDLQFLEGGTAARRTQSYYGKFCSVAQSSGTGKTRLLVELPNTRVLYMNLGKLTATNRYTYPPRDPIPAEMLSAKACSETQFEQKCCAFFAAIFATVNDELTNGVGEDLLAWRHAFHPLNETRRDQFFGKLRAQFHSWVS
jgi:hypothetical protein